MKCELCDKVALYLAKKKGYCKDHKEVAVEETKKSLRVNMSSHQANTYHMNHKGIDYIR